MVSESLDRFDDNEGGQTPLDTIVREYCQRYIRGYELQIQLDEDIPKSVSELASELALSDEKIERRYEYLK